MVSLSIVRKKLKNYFQSSFACWKWGLGSFLTIWTWLSESSLKCSSKELVQKRWYIYNNRILYSHKKGVIFVDSEWSLGYIFLSFFFFFWLKQLLNVYFLNLFYLFIFKFYFIFKLYIIVLVWRLITLQYCSGFCHTLTWISHKLKIQVQNNVYIVIYVKGIEKMMYVSVFTHV